MKLITFFFMILLGVSVVSAEQIATVAEIRGIETLQKDCDAGNLKTCVLLGINYKYGDFPFKQDYFKAASLFRKACDGGEALACWSLAWLYQYGKGVRQNKTEALKYYGKACDLKDQYGCDLYAELNSSK